MAIGNGDDVLIRINGDNKGAVSAIRGTSDELSRMGSSSEGLRFNLSSLGQQIFSNMGSFGAFALTANSVLGVIGELGSMVGNVVNTFVSFGETIANVVVGALQQAGQEIYSLTKQVFELNNETERNVYSWQFLLGGKQQAGSLATWLQTASIDFPFTRMDANSAVSSLASRWNDKQIEQFLPILSDLTATRGASAYGGRGMNLQQAAMAATWASEGNWRMMRELKIQRDDLIPYGLDDSDSDTLQATLLPALTAYARAKGLQGAGKKTAHETFWGAESSLQDRLNNFGVAVGGMPTGDPFSITKGSMFAVLKDDLNGISDWMQKHGKDLDHLATILSTILGGAVKDLTGGLQGLATGLHASGLDTLLEGILDNFGKWLNSPNTEAGLKAFGDAFGKLAGSGISTALTAAGNFFDALGRTGVPQGAFNAIINLFNNIGDFFKNHKQDINDFFFHLGQMSGNAIQIIAQGFKDIGNSLKRFKDSMTPEDWANFKWFISTAVASQIYAIAMDFKLMADAIASAVDSLRNMVTLIDKLNQLTGGAAGGFLMNGHGGSSGDGGGTPGGGGGGHDSKMSYMPGGYTANTSTQLHFYGATQATVAGVTNRLLDERDRGSYLAKRTPGGFSSLGILGV
ncbi:MAG TPA: hypothetical protein VFN11_03235 [Ktedonobacterales bacterium]|nr:hypothetical protein [Ktedonobacterales bacterium]